MPKGVTIMTIERQSQTLRGDGPSADSIYFAGNATVLLRYGAFTVLTVPEFVAMQAAVLPGG
jgi:hypothetical protein